MRVVGVFGVSGVGKTRLLERVVARKAAWVRLSAGSLVQEYRPLLDRDSLRMLTNAGLDENQEAIVVGLRHKRENVTKDVLLFDGHLVLDSGKELFEVSIDVVRRLEFDGMIVVREEPTVIVERRSTDATRSRAARSSEEVAVEQSRTIELGTSYARALGIAHAIVSPNQILKLISFVEALEC